MQVKPATFPVTEQLQAPAWIQACGIPEVRPAFVSVPEPGAGEGQAPEAAEGEQFQVAEVTPTDPQQLERAAQAEARAEAEAEGFAQGEAAGRADWEERIRRLDEVVDDLCDVRRRIFASMESEMKDLALHVARAVLERVRRGDTSYVEGLVRQAMDLVADEDDIVISVAPQDRELLASRLEQIALDYPRAGGLAVREDAGIGYGCMVDTRLARVDATLAGRLASIADALNGGDDDAEESKDEDASTSTSTSTSVSTDDAGAGEEEGE